MIGAWIALLLAVVCKKPLTKQEAATQQLELEKETEERSAPLVAHVISDPEGKPARGAASYRRRDVAPRRNNLSLSALTAELSTTTTPSRPAVGAGVLAAAKPPAQAAPAVAEQGPWNDQADADERYNNRWKRRWAAFCSRDVFMKVWRLPRTGWDALKEERNFKCGIYTPRGPCDATARHSVGLPCPHACPTMTPCLTTCSVG